MAASDIGGTLVQGIRPIPPFTAAVLNRLVEEIPIALITGYNYKTTLTFTGNLDERILLMPQNGTLCIKENQLVWEYRIPVPEARQLAAYLHENNLPVIVYKGRNGDFKNYYFSHNEIPSLSYGFERLPSIDYYEDITGISTLVPDEAAREVRAKIQSIVGERFTVIYSRGGKDSWLEICHAEVRKDLALKRLCDELSIPLADTLYFGDNFNDLEALRLVGYPVLVDNAAPELKVEFNTIIPPVQSEGAAHYLNDLYNLRVVQPRAVET